MRKAALTLFVSLFASAAVALPDGPVQVGGSDNFDACGGYGVVLATTTLFTVDADGYIRFNETVSVNQGAMMCDSDASDEYVGIVFSENGQDCRVSSPIPNRAPYNGPCRSGWIKKSFIELIAG